MLSRLAICLWSTSYGFCFCPLFKFSPILFLLKFLSFALTLSPFLNSLFCLQICIDLNIFELILLPRNIFEFIILSTDLYWWLQTILNSFFCLQICVDDERSEHYKTLHFQANPGLIINRSSNCELTNSQVLNKY